MRVPFAFRGLGLSCGVAGSALPGKVRVRALVLAESSADAEGTAAAYYPQNANEDVQQEVDVDASAVQSTVDAIPRPRDILMANLLDRLWEQGAALQGVRIESVSVVVNWEEERGEESGVEKAQKRACHTQELRRRAGQEKKKHGWSEAVAVLDSSSTTTSTDEDGGESGAAAGKTEKGGPPKVATDAGTQKTEWGEGKRNASKQRQETVTWGAHFRKLFFSLFTRSGTTNRGQPRRSCSAIDSTDPPTALALPASTPADVGAAPAAAEGGSSEEDTTRNISDVSTARTPRSRFSESGTKMRIRSGPFYALPEHLGSSLQELFRRTERVVNSAEGNDEEEQQVVRADVQTIPNEQQRHQNHVQQRCLRPSISAGCGRIIAQGLRRLAGRRSCTSEATSSCKEKDQVAVPDQVSVPEKKEAPLSLSTSIEKDTPKAYTVTLLFRTRPFLFGQSLAGFLSNRPMLPLQDSTVEVGPNHHHNLFVQLLVAVALDVEENGKSNHLPEKKEEQGFRESMSEPGGDFVVVPPASSPSSAQSRPTRSAASASGRSRVLRRSPSCPDLIDLTGPEEIEGTNGEQPQPSLITDVDGWMGFDLDAEVDTSPARQSVLRAFEIVPVLKACKDDAARLARSSRAAAGKDQAAVDRWEQHPQVQAEPSTPGWQSTAASQGAPASASRCRRAFFKEYHAGRILFSERPWKASKRTERDKVLSWRFSADTNPWGLSCSFDLHGIKDDYPASSTVKLWRATKLHLETEIPLKRFVVEEMERALVDPVQDGDGGRRRGEGEGYSRSSGTADVDADSHLALLATLDAGSREVGSRRDVIPPLALPPLVGARSAEAAFPSLWAAAGGTPDEGEVEGDESDEPRPVLRRMRAGLPASDGDASAEVLAREQQRVDARTQADPPPASARRLARASRLLARRGMALPSSLSIGASASSSSALNRAQLPAAAGGYRPMDRFSVYHSISEPASASPGERVAFTEDDQLSTHTLVEASAGLLFARPVPRSPPLDGSLPAALATGAGTVGGSTVPGGDHLGVRTVHRSSDDMLVAFNNGALPDSNTPEDSDVLRPDVGVSGGPTSLTPTRESDVRPAGRRQRERRRSASAPGCAGAPPQPCSSECETAPRPHPPLFRIRPALPYGEVGDRKSADLFVQDLLHENVRQDMLAWALQKANKKKKAAAAKKALRETWEVVRSGFALGSQPRGDLLDDRPLVLPAAASGSQAAEDAGAGGWGAVAESGGGIGRAGTSATHPPPMPVASRSAKAPKQALGYGHRFAKRTQVLSHTWVPEWSKEKNWVVVADFSRYAHLSTYDQYREDEEDFFLANVARASPSSSLPANPGVGNSVGDPRLREAVPVVLGRDEGQTAGTSGAVRSDNGGGEGTPMVMNSELPRGAPAPASGFDNMKASPGPTGALRQYESAKCVICLEENSEYMFASCRHVCLCGECAQLYGYKDSEVAKCPVCNRRGPLAP